MSKVYNVECDVILDIKNLSSKKYPENKDILDFLTTRFPGIEKFITFIDVMDATPISKESEYNL